MQHTYIKYADFDHRVVQLVGRQVYELNKHHLPEVSLSHRDRFLQTLYNCGDICTAYAIVTLGHALADENFLRFSKYKLAFR